MRERYCADGQDEKDEGEAGVGEEPEGLAAEVADGFALRDVLIRVHWLSPLRLLQVENDEAKLSYVFCCMARSDLRPAI